MSQSLMAMFDTVSSKDRRLHAEAYASVQQATQAPRRMDSDVGGVQPVGRDGSSATPHGAQ